jgi:hypothetical protein
MCLLCVVAVPGVQLCGGSVQVPSQNAAYADGCIGEGREGTFATMHGPNCVVDAVLLPGTCSCESEGVRLRLPCIRACCAIGGLELLGCHVMIRSSRSSTAQFVTLQRCVTYHTKRMLDKVQSVVQGAPVAPAVQRVAPTSSASGGKFRVTLVNASAAACILPTPMWVIAARA